MISHCWVTAPKWDLTAQGLQTIAYSIHPLVSDSPSEVHPRGYHQHHGQSGVWQVNGQMEG